MSSLVKYNTPSMSDIFPSWANWDRFDDFLINHDPWTTGVAHRPSNQYRWDETDDSYTLDIVMPGLTKKDIGLTFKDRTLTIKCKKEVAPTRLIRCIICNIRILYLKIIVSNIMNSS